MSAPGPKCPTSVRARRLLPWAGALIGAAAMTWLLRGFSLDHFRRVFAGADLRWLAAIPVAILIEQWVRAWKWQQLLLTLRPIGVLRLFGAIMAGYLIAYLIPLGFGTLARAWLVARREQLELPAVLATVALDRLTDGVVFALLVPLALLLVTFDDPSGQIHAGLVWGAALSLALFCGLLLALVAHRRTVSRNDARQPNWFSRLAPAVGGLLRRFDAAFVRGIAWPAQRWRGVAVMLASLTIKLIALTPLLLAGHAIGVQLAPSAYLFVMVFLGFLLILGHFLRLLGSFVIGGVFALGLFGVGPEPALAMVLMVEAASLLSVAVTGALSLWSQGVALADVRVGVPGTLQTTR
jgi:uncharacterized membrane protein YbhN (UPF0104 family)